MTKRISPGTERNVAGLGLRWAVGLSTVPLLGREGASWDSSRFDMAEGCRVAGVVREGWRV